MSGPKNANSDQSSASIQSPMIRQSTNRSPTSHDPDPDPIQPSTQSMDNFESPNAPYENSSDRGASEESEESTDSEDDAAQYINQRYELVTASSTWHSINLKKREKERKRAF